MSAAPERTWLKIQYSLHSLLGEQEMLPNAPGCSAFCCHLAVRQLQGWAMSFISFHPLVVSFSLFLLALRSNGLIQDCWWNSSYCWDQVEKHSSLWRALSLTEVFDDGIFLACRWVPCLSPWSASTKSQTLVFQACRVLPCSREVRTLFSAQDACFPPVGEVMINGKNSSV